MFNLEKLEHHVAIGDILKNPHPTENIFIYSYNKVWYEDWTPELRWARGLILDSFGQVIACPIPKFFNYGEVPSEVNLRLAKGYKYSIQEKYDGSLGILFYYNNKWHLSTKGSFVSEQAIKGKQILDSKYKSYAELDKQYTYLFEIIYPENQIVVNYTEEQMILLAITDPKTLKEIEISNQNIPKSFDIVKYYTDRTIDNILEDLKREDYIGSEGFVVVFEDSYRAKFKYDEYVRLHKIVSDFTPKKIIELMKSGGNIDDMINSLPDEFRQEIIDIRDSTLFAYELIYKNILTTYLNILPRVTTKKEYASAVFAEFRNKKKCSIMFHLWDNVDILGDIDKIKADTRINSLIYDIIIDSL